MKRRISVSGELLAGAFAGLLSLVPLVGLLVVTALLAPDRMGPLRSSMLGVEKPVRQGIAHLLPGVAGTVESLPFPSVLMTTLALSALLVGMLFAALVREVRAAASVMFWAVLVGAGLGVLAAQVGTPLTPLGPGLRFVAGSLFGIGLSLVLAFRRALAVPYEPRLAAEPPREPDLEDAAAVSPYLSYEVGAA
jgi:hypothetical protein